MPSIDNKTARDPSTHLGFFLDFPNMQILMDNLLPNDDGDDTSSSASTPIPTQFARGSNLMAKAFDKSSASQDLLKNSLYHYNKSANLLIILSLTDMRFCLGDKSIPRDFVERQIKDKLRQQPDSTQQPDKFRVVHLNISPSISGSASHVTGTFLGSDAAEDSKIILADPPLGFGCGATMIAFRVAQLLRDVHSISDNAIKAHVREMFRFGSSTRLTAERSESIHRAPEYISVLQKGDSLEGVVVDDNQRLSSLRRDLLAMTEIYAGRVNSGQKFLGAFGLYGRHTAQSKLDALNSFLANESKPLQAAAKQGLLGQLIAKYKAAKRLTVEEGFKDTQEESTQQATRRLEFIKLLQKYAGHLSGHVNDRFYSRSVLNEKLAAVSIAMAEAEKKGANITRIIESLETLSPIMEHSFWGKLKRSEGARIVATFKAKHKL